MRRYSSEYKHESARLVMERGGKIQAVSRELGISHWTLKDWVKQYRSEINAQCLSSGQMRPEEEIMLLKKELASLREDHEILKKAIAVFSSKPKIGTDL